MRPDGMIGDPFNTGTLNQFAPEDDPRGGGGPPSRPSAAGAGGGGGSRGGFDPGGGSGGSGIENAGTGASTRFTRWVYKKGTSQFAFVFDRRNRVVQIEAVGLNDYRVKTRRSVKFGSDFSSIIKSYGAPEGYDVGGNNLVVKYLVDTKVAFRLTRTQPNAPHRVTGIVIAAGKG